MKLQWVHNFDYLYQGLSRMKNPLDNLRFVFLILWQVDQYFWNFQLKECKKGRFIVPRADVI